MIWLLRDFDFLSVLLRALSFGMEALTVGGVAYLLAVLLPVRPGLPSVQSARQLLRWVALGLATAQAAYVAVNTSILMGSAGLRLSDLLSASYFVTGAAAVVAALVIAACAKATGRIAVWMLAVCSAIVLGAAVSTSHSVSRLDHRAVLAVLTTAHHLGAAIWIGAMPYLLVTMRRARSDEEARRMAKRFSPMAIAGVSILLAGGAGMAWFYIGGGHTPSGLGNGLGSRFWSGLYGTSYGVLLLAKVYLLLLILTLGGGNFLLVRQIEHAPSGLLVRLRRFGEAEIGLGFTALLAAASMTSQPPAVDIPQDHVSLHAIIERMRPEWPRLSSPPLAALAPATSVAEEARQGQFGVGSFSDANDRAWSEYNHHWAGLIVLVAGALALLARSGRARWARNWPLAFAALAVFIVLRADPECWPLGPRPFWASFYASDVLQHRMYAVLILGFAVFEWGVETGRLHSRRMALVFPGLCAAGGALLLTHTHADGNMQEELLAELTHTPIALLGATAGWLRWLELRLPDARQVKIAAYIWPACLMLVGVVLLNYREG